MVLACEIIFSSTSLDGRPRNLHTFSKVNLNYTKRTFPVGQARCSFHLPHSYNLQILLARGNGASTNVEPWGPSEPSKMEENFKATRLILQMHYGLFIWWTNISIYLALGDDVHPFHTNSSNSNPWMLQRIENDFTKYLRVVFSVLSVLSNNSPSNIFPNMFSLERFHWIRNYLFDIKFLIESPGCFLGVVSIYDESKT